MRKTKFCICIDFNVGKAKVAGEIKEELAPDKSAKFCFFDCPKITSTFVFKLSVKFVTAVLETAVDANNNLRRRTFKVTASDGSR